MRWIPTLLLGLTLAACGGPSDGEGGGSAASDGCGEPAATGTVLKFTAIPDQNTTELERKYQPVADYLAEALGIAVEYVPARDYPASVEMFENGTVHLAWFGGLTGVQARERVKGARAIAMGAEDKQFKSYFIAHRDAGIEPSESFPAGIAGLSFTFGSASSTSGRLMPEYFIMRNTGGKTAQEFFETPPNFSGSHDKTCELVDSGQYQAGVLNYTVFERRREQGDVDDCVVIWTTPAYVDYNFTAHPAIDGMFGAGTIDRLQDALVAMPEDLVGSAFARSKMIAASNADFDTIREVAQKTDMLGQ